jgi:acyl-CoA synthetase (AMP-forming)/AMP-acid ligase II
MAGETLLSTLTGGAAEHSALTVPGGPNLTYERLRALVTEAGDILASLGLGRGDRVAMALPNGSEAVALFLATAGIATAAPLNPAYKEEEFRFYLEDTGARALIVPPGEGAAARAALPEGAILIEAAIDADGKLSVESSAPRDPGRPAEPAQPDDVALVLHTSGTTSRPKLVPLRHRNVMASIGNIVTTYNLGPDDVSLCVMPLFHVHGLVASTLSTLRSGGTVVVPTRFSPHSFWTVAQNHGATWYSAVPTIHQMLLMRAGTERPEGSRTLRFIRSCSSALSPTTMEALEEHFGAPVLEAYGMTEASHQIASNPLPPLPRLPGSVGHPTGVQVAIMGEGGELLPPGARGEVVIRGPNVVDGYERNPDANRASFTSGWFRTGDDGTVDEAGYVVLLGRIKELINRGGEKIAPREIDEVLLSHPAVAEAVAFAIPHPTWGEEVGAAVVLNQDVSEKELIGYSRERLADFKVPRKIFVTPAIPRTATGKVQRLHVARAMLAPE